MQFARSLLFFVLMSLLVVVFLPVAFASLLVQPNTRMRWLTGWSHTVVWLLDVLCGLKHEVTGYDNLPDEPVIFMIKHQSAWETLVMQVILPPSVWVLKRELMWLPVFGWAVACTDPIAINRKNRRLALDSLIEQGRQKLQQGRNIIIFPEGTRTPYGAATRYKQGGSKLAIATGARIVPVAHNAGKFWKRRSLTKHPGTIQVAIGPPITTAGRTPEQVTAQVKQWIETQLQEWSTHYETKPTTMPKPSQPIDR